MYSLSYSHHLMSMKEELPNMKQGLLSIDREEALLDVSISAEAEARFAAVGSLAPTSIGPLG
ncbi:hypothetical protein GYMC52_3252 [Geobacillus sp. Y412MC52]|nr:hypothetical protein GYMC52_3252 [Geobacillus sp. Y412MC52]